MQLRDNSKSFIVFIIKLYKIENKILQKVVINHDKKV